jgi:hypothetical protein
MAENEYEHLEQALPGFSRARMIVKGTGDSTRPLGFKGSKFDFYRFANRFRLATSFRGMDLEGFTPETTDGYGSLTRVLFTWTAFEGYADLANDPAPPYRTSLPHLPTAPSWPIIHYITSAISRSSAVKRTLRIS